jgi:hypothetical protein
MWPFRTNSNVATGKSKRNSTGLGFTPSFALLASEATKLFRVPNFYYFDIRLSIYMYTYIYCFLNYTRIGRGGRCTHIKRGRWGRGLWRLKRLRTHRRRGRRSPLLAGRRRDPMIMIRTSKWPQEHVDEGKINGARFSLQNTGDLREKLWPQLPESSLSISAEN